VLLIIMLFKFLRLVIRKISNFFSGSPQPSSA
jgi:hypothetical protein